MECDNVINAKLKKIFKIHKIKEQVISVMIIGASR